MSGRESPLLARAPPWTAKPFSNTCRTYHAVVHCLLIVGEAANHILEDVRQRMPEIEWRKIAGMRGWMAHAYFSISDDILWSVVETKAPELLRAVEGFVDEDGP